jgi:succinate dehydrogenase hydrophobic anchor subunit
MIFTSHFFTAHFFKCNEFELCVQYFVRTLSNFTYVLVFVAIVTYTLHSIEGIKQVSEDFSKSTEERPET